MNENEATFLTYPESTGEKGYEFSYCINQTSFQTLTFTLLTKTNMRE